LVHAFHGGQFGLIEFLPAAYRLYRNGMRIHMEPRRFDALTLLVENRGRVVTKAELREKVWFQTRVDDGAIHRCISDIRSALGDASAIQTVHSRGYQFVREVQTTFERAPVEAAERR
jgi:DNA-binding winged helix-turn-helix (wHTH) protein